MQKQWLAQEHLDRRFAKMGSVSLFTRPNRGWIRAIRDALGMSATQLAARLGVSQPRVAALEKGEVEGTLTLQSLQKAAQALDCTLVYALIPNKPLEQMVRTQAERMAAERMAVVEQTMRLEDQAVGTPESARQRQRLIEQILSTETRHLWEQR